MDIAFLVAAHNEEKNLENSLNSLFSQNLSPKINPFYFVCANACTDNTLKIAEQISNSKKNFFVLEEKRKGKPFALNALLKFVLSNPKTRKFRYLFFFDADSLLEKNSAQKIIDKFEYSDFLGIGARNLSIKRSKESLKEEFIRSMIDIGHRSGKHKFLIGRFYAVKASAVKGLKFPENVLDEDLWISLKLGEENIFNERSSKVYFFTPSSLKEFFEQLSRQISGMYQLYDLFPEKAESMIGLKKGAYSIKTVLKKSFAVPSKNLSLKQKLFSILSIPVFAVLKFSGFRRFKSRNLRIEWKQIKSSKGFFLL